MEIKVPIEELEKKRDREVLKMLLEVIEILGGPRRISEYRNLTWIPSIIKASYALLLQEAGKTQEEIARELGVTKATVQKMLRSDESEVLKKIKGEIAEEFDEHVAGGLAKLAWKRVREKEAEEEIESVTKTAEILGADWAVRIAERLRGLDFPVEREQLEQRLKGLVIREIPIEEILEELDYPMKSPADLLHQVSQRLKQRRS